MRVHISSHNVLSFLSTHSIKVSVSSIGDIKHLRSNIMSDTQGPRPDLTVIQDAATGDHIRVSDYGSRVDVYNGDTHSWSTYDQQGNLTGGGVGETHPH